MSCKEEPGSRWDKALLGVAIAASVPFIAANIVVLLHRKRSYFRAQGGAPLILASSIAGLIWITAAFVANFHFPRNYHRLLLNCPLWSFWLMLTFGVWLWLACQITRLLHLHFLCQNTTSAYSTERRSFLCFLFLWTPGLAFTIVANATHASHRTGHDLCANCTLHAGWKYCTFIIVPLMYFIILVIVLFRSKNSKDYMMAVERSHTSEYSFIMVFVIYLLYGATFVTRSQKKVSGRCFLTFCVCFVIFINFWVRLGWPVYLCVWKGEAGINSFEEELRCYGAHCLELSSATGAARSIGRSSSSLQYGDWILRAIDAAMSEASDCKERINQLEQRKATLSAKIKNLGSSTSAKYMSSSASAKGL